MEEAGGRVGEHQRTMGKLSMVSGGAGGGWSERRNGKSDDVFWAREREREKRAEDVNGREKG